MECCFLWPTERSKRSKGTQAIGGARRTNIAGALHGHLSHDWPARALAMERLLSRHWSAPQDARPGSRDSYRIPVAEYRLRDCDRKFPIQLRKQSVPLSARRVLSGASRDRTQQVVRFEDPRRQGSFAIRIAALDERRHR